MSDIHLDDAPRDSPERLGRWLAFNYRKGASANTLREAAEIIASDMKWSDPASIVGNAIQLVIDRCYLDLTGALPAHCIFGSMQNLYTELIIRVYRRRLYHFRPIGGYSADDIEALLVLMRERFRPARAANRLPLDMGKVAARNPNDWYEEAALQLQKHEISPRLDLCRFLRPERRIHYGDYSNYMAIGEFMSLSHDWERLGILPLLSLEIPDE